MKIKKLLRFYYSAGSLNGALDNIIMHVALSAGGDTFSGCEAYADKIADIIGAKAKLADLWARLNTVLCDMTDRDVKALKRYAALRTGVDGEEKREIHRAVVKFTRRAARLLKGAEAEYKILCAYQCLLSYKPD
ncbi:MAG: hypothetical protein K2K39_02720 [Clostridia bacterium]|nr:hypothetical protein [Clostridia bacterium]